jgi:hypothetical protein
LLRWLEVRGYEYEKRKVSEIQSQTNVEVAKDLIRIFNIETDENEIEKSIYMLQFFEEQRELFDCYQENKNKLQQIIDDYHIGYNQLVEDLYDDQCEIARIKANIENMVTNYRWLIELNHREMFWNLVNSRSVSAIMCLLMNEITRKYYLLHPWEKDFNEIRHVIKEIPLQTKQQYEKRKDEENSNILQFDMDDNDDDK